jgi:glutathione transport system substrate-binding protein
MAKRLIVLVVLLLGLVAFLGACSSKENASSDSKSGDAAGEKSGGSLTFGLAAEPTTMDPYIQNGTHGRTVKFAIFRGLYNYNEKGELEAELAESYTTNDELTQYTFKLRDAKFHNGDPVTAEDVKFTYERILAPDSKATFKTELSIISSIEVVDEKTITFNLSEPSAPFIHYTALPESVVVSKSYTEENGDDIATKPMDHLSLFHGFKEAISLLKSLKITTKKANLI